VGLRVDQIEEAVAARVAAVDASPFDQRTPGSALGAPAFTESEIALTSDAEGAVSHLRFLIMAQDARVIDDRQLPGTDSKTLSTLAVVFLYHLRPTAQVADQRLAARAASAIVRAVKAMPQADWRATVRDAWQPTISPNGEWLLVSIAFEILYEQPV